MPLVKCKVGNNQSNHVYFLLPLSFCLLLRATTVLPENCHRSSIWWVASCLNYIKCDKRKVNRLKLKGWEGFSNFPFSRCINLVYLYFVPSFDNNLDINYINVWVEHCLELTVWIELRYTYFLIIVIYKFLF